MEFGNHRQYVKYQEIYSSTSEGSCFLVIKGKLLWAMQIKSRLFTLLIIQVWRKKSHAQEQFA